MSKQDCPFWRGKCREHNCRLYIQIKGHNPNTGEQMNKWGCSFEFLPMLLIENSQQQRHTAASVDKFHNDNAAVNQVAIEALNSLMRVAKLEAPEHSPKLINGK